MKTNRQQAKDIMARIHELLQPLASVDSATFSSEGTSLNSLTCKLRIVPLEGGTKVSFEKAPSGKYPVGTVWYSSSKDMYYKVLECVLKRKYSYSVMAYDGKNVVSRTTGTFLDSCTQVTIPTFADFRLYLTMAYDDDRLTSQQLTIWDSVDNTYAFIFRENEELAQKVLDLVDKLSEATRKANVKSIYDTLFIKKSTTALNDTYLLLKKLYKDGK
jgi:hypothetical protein